MTPAPREEPWLDAPARVSWRAYGLGLLPLAAAGWLPWWSAALLCMLYGLAVRWLRWEEGRLLLSLLVVGAAAVALAPAALAQGIGALVGLALHYLALFFVVLALNWSANRISDGLRRSRTALFLPLLIGLLAPQPGLLLALAGGLLAVPGRDERMGRRPERPVPGVWWVVGAALATLLVLSALLPRQAVDWAALGQPASPASTAQPPASGLLPPLDLSLTPPAPATPGLELPFQFTIGNIFLPTDLILVGGLLLLAAGSGGVLKARRQEGGKPRPVELLMVAGLLLTGALWLVAGMLLAGGGGSGGPQAGGPGAGNALGELLKNITGRQQIDISSFVQALMWFSLVALFALAAALFWLNFGQPREKEGDAKALDTREDMALVSTQPALHRVRLAYRQAEEALRQHGRGRMASETPAGYAARLSALDALLAAPLDTLTRAYGPVRYGGRVTDEDAAQAEVAAHELAAVLPDLPPPHSPSENLPNSFPHEENP